MKYILLIIFSFFVCFGSAQSFDSLQVASLQAEDSLQAKKIIKRDTVAIKVDSVAYRDSILADSVYKAIQSGFYRGIDSVVYQHNPFIAFTDPVKQISLKREWKGKEPFFYVIIFLLLFFALTKNSFPRYLKDIFRIFFRTSLKQRQIKEQMLHAPLPSLLLNLVFLLSGSLYIVLLFRHYNIGMEYGFWFLLVYCFLGLAVIYVGKLVTLKLFGWLLSIKDATDIYIYIVFSANKVAGVMLLPFIVGLAFTNGIFYAVFFTVSLIFISALYLYRFYLSFVSIQKYIDINFFHFIIYLCAFEIAPLLLINKLLFTFFTETH